MDMSTFEERYGKANIRQRGAFDAAGDAAEAAHFTHGAFSEDIALPAASSLSQRRFHTHPTHADPSSGVAYSGATSTHFAPTNNRTNNNYTTTDNDANHHGCNKHDVEHVYKSRGDDNNTDIYNSNANASTTNSSAVGSLLWAYAQWYSTDSMSRGSAGHAIVMTEYFARLTAESGTHAEAELWLLIQDVLLDAESGSSMYPNAIEVHTRVPPHRRWFVSHMAHIQHFVQSHAVWRRMNTICMWLEYTHRARTPAWAPLTGSDATSLRELVWSHIRGGALHRAVESAVSAHDGVLACLLRATQLQSVAERWGNETVVVPLMGEYGHTQVKQSWCGNEHRLAALAQLFRTTTANAMHVDANANRATGLGKAAMYSQDSSTHVRSTQTVSSRNNHNNTTSSTNTSNDRSNNRSNADNRAGNSIVSAELDAMIAAALSGHLEVLEEAYTVHGNWRDVLWCHLRCALVMSFTRILIDAGFDLEPDYAAYVCAITGEREQNTLASRTNASAPSSSSSSLAGYANWAQTYAKRVVTSLATRLRTSYLSTPHELADELQMRVVLHVLCEGVDGLSHVEWLGGVDAPSPKYNLVSHRNKNNTRTNYHNDTANNSADSNTAHDVCDDDAIRDSNAEEERVNRVRLMTHTLLTLDAAYADTLLTHAIQVRLGDELAQLLAAYARALTVPPHPTSLHTLDRPLAGLPSTRLSSLRDTRITNERGRVDSVTAVRPYSSSLSMLQPSAFLCMNNNSSNSSSNSNNIKSSTSNNSTNNTSFMTTPYSLELGMAHVIAMARRLHDPRHRALAYAAFLRAARARAVRSTTHGTSSTMGSTSCTEDDAVDRAAVEQQEARLVCMFVEADDSAVVRQRVQALLLRGAGLCGEGDRDRADAWHANSPRSAAGEGRAENLMNEENAGSSALAMTTSLKRQQNKEGSTTSNSNADHNSDDTGNFNDIKYMEYGNIDTATYPTVLLTHHPVSEEILWAAMHARHGSGEQRAVLERGLCACAMFWCDTAAGAATQQLDAIADVCGILTRHILPRLLGNEDATLPRAHHYNSNNTINVNDDTNKDVNSDDDAPGVRGGVGMSASERSELTFWLSCTELCGVCEAHSRAAGELASASASCSSGSASRTRLFQLAQEEAALLHRAHTLAQRAVCCGGAVVHRERCCITAVVFTIEKLTAAVTLAFMVRNRSEHNDSCDATSCERGHNDSSSNEEDTNCSTVSAAGLGSDGEEDLSLLQDVMSLIAELDGAGYLHPDLLPQKWAAGLFAQVRSMRVAYGKRLHARQVQRTLQAARQMAEGV